MTRRWLLTGALLAFGLFVVSCGKQKSGGNDQVDGHTEVDEDDACVAGACACSAGLTACGASCVDLGSDGANCGQCGNACPAPLVCAEGKCSERCTAGLTQCGSSCAELLTDVHNCGSCGKSCPGGACVQGQCSSGGADDAGTGSPANVCSEPEPWPTPATTHVVGDGVAASCTAEALREAVTSGGYVRFDCGQAPVTLRIPAEIEVSRETVVDGEGKITLDGGGSSRIFVVGSALSVRNLRFVNGKAGADDIGGAVAGNWRSRVEVYGCTFEDNTAGSAGGAVGVWTGSSLTVVASQFRRNRSGYGGAIYSLWSPLLVVNSEFTDNETLNESAAGAIGTDGALDPDYRSETAGGTVEICGSVFRNNRAKGAGGAAMLWVYPPDRITIDRCTIEGNAVTKDSGGDGLAMGGGMRVSNGEIIVKATSFLSNSAETHGGGLYLDCEPTCTIKNSTFYSNRVSDGYGGAIFGDKLRVNNVTFSKNFANGHGGALFGGSDWQLRNSVFADNEAGNPWGQAHSCAATGSGDHVLQWVSELGGAGSDPCIPEVTAADPMLADPADNGGPTFTLLPAAGSPALQAGSGCEAVDQRGQPRDASACDLGAVELE